MRRVRDHNKHNYLFLLLISSLFVMLFSTDASSTDKGISDSPYFIEGYDVVSYFRYTGPLLGNTEYATEHENSLMLFSSEKNMMDFLSNPEDYMPAYGGYCAYGMVYGMTSKIDPLQYDIVEGRLYLQLDRGTKRRWNRRVVRYIKKSDKAWRKLSNSKTNN